jgi:hypothetical protein
VKILLVGQTFYETEQLLEAITEFWMKFTRQKWSRLSATG